MDYEKAFDSAHRQTLWKLSRHYGKPEKITNIFRNSYEGMTCRLVHRRQHTDTFEVRPGVRQGCLRSPVMFPLTMDWVMKTSTVQERSGIQWTLWRQLNDLDYVDYLALLSHTRHQMQEKTSAIADAVAHLDLNIHNGKRNVLTFNTVTHTPIVWEAEALDEVESFTYLGSIVDTTVHCRRRGGGGGGRSWCKSSHRQGKSSFPTAEECLEIITPRHQH